MRPADRAWAALVATGVGLEVYGLRGHPDWMLSRVTRRLWHTNHPFGRLAFIASWGALSAWLVPHICKNP